MNSSINQVCGDPYVIMGSLCLLIGFTGGTCVGAMSNEIEILKEENERLRKELVYLVEDEDLGIEVGSRDGGSPWRMKKAERVRSRDGVIEIEEEMKSVKSLGDRG